MAVGEKGGDRRSRLQIELLVLVEVDKGEVPADFPEAPLNRLPDPAHDSVTTRLPRVERSPLVGDLECRVSVGVSTVSECIEKGQDIDPGNHDHQGAVEHDASEKARIAEHLHVVSAPLKRPVTNRPVEEVLIIDVAVRVGHALRKSIIESAHEFTTQANINKSIEP